VTGTSSLRRAGGHDEARLNVAQDGPCRRLGGVHGRMPKNRLQPSTVISFPYG
jgi:hypothetical protein